MEWTQLLAFVVSVFAIMGGLGAALAWLDKRHREDLAKMDAKIDKIDEKWELLFEKWFEKKNG